MPAQFTSLQKCAFAFAALFLGVYSLDFVPGIMDRHGLMFGLFHMSRLIDLGHLGAGTLALVAAVVSARASRYYFWLLALWYSLDVAMYFVSHLGTLPLITNLLVNLPHILIFIAAYWIALKAGKPAAEADLP